MRIGEGMAMPHSAGAYQHEIRRCPSALPAGTPTCPRSQPLLDEKLQLLERAKYPTITHPCPKSHWTSPGCSGLCRELQPWGSAGLYQCSCSAQAVFSHRCWTRMGARSLGTGGDTSQYLSAKPALLSTGSSS